MTEGDDPGLAGFVAALPKVDLHLHLVGAASPQTVLGLARRYPDAGVPTEPAELERFYRFTSLDHFAVVYSAVNRLLRTGPDLAALVAGLADDLAANAVRYAEVTVTPTTHLAAGIAPDELAEALTAGRRAARERTGVELAWVFDASGELGPPNVDATLGWVLRHRPEATVGFGVGGPETGAPRAWFAPAFRRAIEAGLHSVPHAGETPAAGASEVRVALEELGAERIGHGIRSVDDPELLRELADRGVPLEVCPTSNLRTGSVRSLPEHPIPTLLAAGVRVTLGTDDPGMFGTDLTREYRLCHEQFGLDRAGLLGLARAGVRSAFCPEDVRAKLLAELARSAGSGAGMAEQLPASQPPSR